MIQLLITDVIMSKMNGMELYEEINKIKENIPTIFMSGYTAEIFEEKRPPHGNATFLSKPLKPGILLIAIRQMLDDASCLTCQEPSMPLNRHQTTRP